jgi:hypothetical protein
MKRYAFIVGALVLLVSGAVYAVGQTVLGVNALAGNYGTAVGRDSAASSYGTAIGDSSESLMDGVAVGVGAYAHYSGVAIGAYAVNVTGDNQGEDSGVAVGQSSMAVVDGTALGAGALALGQWSIALGEGSEAAPNEVVFGSAYDGGGGIHAGIKTLRCAVPPGEVSPLTAVNDPTTDGESGLYIAVRSGGATVARQVKLGAASGGRRILYVDE